MGKPTLSVRIEYPGVIVGRTTRRTETSKYPKEKRPLFRYSVSSGERKRRSPNLDVSRGVSDSA